MSTHDRFDRHDAVHLRSPAGDRVVVLPHGAHVVSWVTRTAGRPGDAPIERLYLSPTSALGDGAAIRGGVPVVFPQFNQRGPDTGLPKHGFARNRRWAVAERRADSATLRLVDDDASRALWPHRFELSLTITIADARLDLELAVAHPPGLVGDAGAVIDVGPFRFTAALHTYLAVGDVTAATVDGLAGTRLLDTVVDRPDVAPQAPLAFAGQTDRIYWDAPASLMLRAPAGRLKVSMAGFEDTVIWTPGAELAATLPDLPDDDWRRMLCIEAARIGRPVVLAAGERWVGRQTLEVT